MALEPPADATGAVAGPIPHWYDGEDDAATIVDGEGVRVTDAGGAEYLDFASQLYCVNAGHDEERIVEAIEAQLRRVPYVSSGAHNDARSELARRLREVAPEPLESVVFSVTGSEANETAAMLARSYTGAGTVLTRWRSYHGGTYGAGSFTGDPATRSTIESEAATTGAGKFLPPIPRAFGTDDPDELAERAGDHLEFVIRNEGPDSIAAIMMEPVAGSSGAYTAPPGYVERVRELCDAYDVLLIADEVITGFGRCGDWFGVQTEGVAPDLLTFAKGVTSAYVPLAGVLARPEIRDHLDGRGFDVGQTFAGHPVACAAGCAAMDVYADDLLDNVAAVAPTLEARLQDLEDRHPEVASTHGRGLLRGVSFADPDTGEPFVDPRVDDRDNPVDDVLEGARERGAIFGAGRPNVQVIVAPPLCVDEREIDEAVTALDRAIDDAF